PLAHRHRAARGHARWRSAGAVAQGVRAAGVARAPRGPGGDATAAVARAVGPDAPAGHALRAHPGGEAAAEAGRRCGVAEVDRDGAGRGATIPVDRLTLAEARTTIAP